MFPNVVNPANDNLVSRTSKVGKNLLLKYKNKIKVNNVKKGGVNSFVPGNYSVQGNSLEPGNYYFPAIDTEKIIKNGKPFTLDDGNPIIFIFDGDPIIFLDKRENKTSELKIVKPAMIAVKWLTNIINDENLTIEKKNIIGYQNIVNYYQCSYNSDENTPYEDSHQLMLHIHHFVFPNIFQYYSIYYNGAIIVANNGENYNELIKMIRTRI
jgi:hypothetical protein